MELKFKRLSDKAILPIRAHKGDAGLDLTCTNITTTLNKCGQVLIEYHTDLAVEIPEGYVGLLFPRSSIYKNSLILSNSVGVIDSGYRGEIKGIFRNTTDVVPAVYQIGERFCQLVVVPIPEIEVVEAVELSHSDREEDGFGSTGDANETSAVTGTQSLPETEDASTNSESAPEQAAGEENAPEQV